MNYAKSHFAQRWRRVLTATPALILMLLSLHGSGQVADSAKARSNNIYISLELKNESLLDALGKIERITSYRFAYQREQLAKYQSLNLSKVRRTLNETLVLLLENTGLKFRESGNTIILFRQSTDNPPQERINSLYITGSVLTTQGEPLAGASVVLGRTGTGTKTDGNGRFSIAVSQTGPAEVVISSVGFETIEQVAQPGTELNVRMVSTGEQLTDVVVTAFGLKQNKRGLSYSVQDIKGEALLKSRQPNLVNSLQGKIAGLQITNSGGVPGASASILLRGGTSLDGNNEPLFVIDGIPVDNSTIAEPPNGGGQLARTVANSNRAIDINPDDIESVSVLKGPSAAALYGLRASGGAIIITTKKGASGRGKISLGSSAEIQKENKLPEVQRSFGMGTGGNEVPSRLSWGPALTKSATVYDNLKNFFQTGNLFTNNLSFSGGTENATVYSSVSRTDQKGIIPNSDFKRTSFRVNADARIRKNLKVSMNSGYINSRGTKPLQGPGVLNGTGGIMTSLLYWPLTDNASDYLNPDGTRRRLVPNINEDIDNPYWSVYNNPVKNSVDRFIGTAQLSYDAAEWLNLTYRLGTDFYKEQFQSLRSPGTSLNGNGSGGLYEADYFNQVTTSTFLARAQKTILENFSASLLVGHNVEWNDYRNNSVFGTDFINPDFVGINNTTNKQFNQFLSRRRIVGVFGDAQIGYKNWAFLNVTGRNDWSSTLPAANRSFFYPSAGVSLIVSEIFHTNPAVLSYAKLRATYAKVGKDAPPHKLNTSLVSDNFIVLGGGFGYGFYSNNALLRPEFTNSTEFGAELQFLNRRLGLDVALYKIESKDQITQPRVSQGTGFIFKLVNGGSIENKGIEVSINAVPVKSKTFNWNVNLNWSHNQARVTDLPVGTSVFRNSDAIAVFNLAEGASFLNGDLYAIRGSTYTTNANGQTIINESGYPTVSKANQKDLGVSRQPNWIAGITNSFSYRDFELSFLIDIRKGGWVFNGTEYELVRSGLSTKTLDRGRSVILPGVVETSPGVFAPNTKEAVLDQTYYSSIYAENALNFIEDGSWTRLRYIAVTYQLNNRLIKKLGIESLSFNITGKNLLLFTNYSGIDPELSSGGAGVRGTGTVGIDYAGLPSTKGLSFGINVGF